MVLSPQSAVPIPRVNGLENVHSLADAVLNRVALIDKRRDLNRFFDTALKQALGFSSCIAQVSWISVSLCPGVRKVLVV